MAATSGVPTGTRIADQAETHMLALSLHPIDLPSSLLSRDYQCPQDGDEREQQRGLKMSTVNVDKHNAIPGQKPSPTKKSRSLAHSPAANQLSTAAIVPGSTRLSQAPMFFARSRVCRGRLPAQKWEDVLQRMQPCVHLQASCMNS